MSSLYIHIPFCKQKCLYCDFYSETHIESCIPEFLNAISQEIQLHQATIQRDLGILDTIYFGGGTPTLLAPDQIGILLQYIQSHVSIHPDAEITIEANPGTVTLDALQQYRDMGINRISIGVQSFNNSELKWLGRIHTAEEAIRSIVMAKEIGFANIGMDLIFGLPGQKISDWKKTVQTAASQNPTHISTYALTWDADTPLRKAIQSGYIIPLDEDTVSDLYLWTSSYLTDNGFEHYEISNFALPGHRCRHNEAYWIGKPYLGLGPSAHSYINHTRFWNHSDVFTYITVLSQNQLPIAERETLDHDQKALEFITLGLRRKEGIPLSYLQQHTEWTSSLIRRGLVKINKHSLSLTHKGFLLADELALQLAS
jgi:oxygen-independent coproporphyrinogen-3 oxidase